MGNKTPKELEQIEFCLRKFDEILDKISKSGYDSLSREEKENGTGNIFVTRSVWLIKLNRQCPKLDRLFSLHGSK